MKRFMGVLVVCVVLSAAMSSNVRSQDLDEPGGCCWLQGWEEAGFMGSDAVLPGPGKWSDWHDRFGSIRVGECADVSVWLQPNYKGAKLELIPGEKRSEFDSDLYKSMEIACKE